MIDIEKRLPMHPDLRRSPCPGYQAKGCGVMTPRYLCYYCTRTAILEARKRGERP